MWWQWPRKKKKRGSKLGTVVALDPLATILVLAIKGLVADQDSKIRHLVIKVLFNHKYNQYFLGNRDIKALVNKDLDNKALVNKVIKVLANKVLANKVLANKDLANKVLVNKALVNKVLANKVSVNKVSANKVLASKFPSMPPPSTTAPPPLVKASLA